MQRSQLAVSMWSMHREYFDHGWSVFDFLDFCAVRAYRQVELLNVFWRNEKEELPRLLERIQHDRFTVAAWAVENDFAREDYAAQVAEIVRGVEVAQLLGTDTVRVFAAHPRSGIDLSATLATVVRGLKEAAEVAEKAGVTLAVENHGLLAGRSTQIVEILDRVGSPWVQANADLGNFLLVDEDPREAVGRLLPRIAHVHVKDMQPVNDGGWTSLGGHHYRGAQVGEGIVPIRDLLALLDQAGYTGYLSLEFEGDGDEAAGVDGSVAALWELLPS